MLRTQHNGWLTEIDIKDISRPRVIAKHYESKFISSASQIGLYEMTGTEEAFITRWSQLQALPIDNFKEQSVRARMVISA
jgi:hypothetical protein